MSFAPSQRVLLQPYRDVIVRVFVMDYRFNIIDEVSGIAENVNFSNDSNSDIRRTASVSIVLESGYTQNGVLNEMFFSSGNGYWFDKYIRVDVGVKNSASNNEYIYYKQGLYLVNEPSISYDPTTNALEFQGVDLMAKLTGMRNGALQGLTYQIPADSVITDVIETILLDQGFYKYVLETPEVPNTPIDISIESGGTAYDLLVELRDINPNWEMFFDVDGVFHFQKIPSGNVVSGYSSENIAPTTVADDTTWDKLLMSYQLTTDFEEVKNYIEVYGKMIDATAVAEVTSISQTQLQLKCLDVTQDSEKIDFVLFTLGDTTKNPVLLNTDIETILLTSGDGTLTIPCHPPIKYNNQSYILRVGGGYAEYLGYQQPMAVAWEENVNSPFYVGNRINNLHSENLITDDDEDIIADNSNNIVGMVFRDEEEEEQYTSPTDKYVKDVTFSNVIRYVCSGDEYDNIYSNQLAMDRAEYELYQKCRLHDSIDITCVPIYYLDSNQVISLTLPNEENPSYWIIKSISTDFGTDGSQTINAMKYYPEYPST